LNQYNYNLKRLLPIFIGYVKGLFMICIMNAPSGIFFGPQTSINRYNKTI